MPNVASPGTLMVPEDELLDELPGREELLDELELDDDDELLLEELELPAGSALHAKSRVVDINTPVSLIARLAFNSDLILSIVLTL